MINTTKERAFNDLKGSGIDVPARRKKRWLHFRLSMPYMCFYNPETRVVWFTNREYKPIGFMPRWTRQHYDGPASEWDRYQLIDRAEYPDAKVSGLTHQTWFYNDDTKPLSCKKAWNAYVGDLKQFLGYTVLQSKDETKSFDLSEALDSWTWKN